MKYLKRIVTYVENVRVKLRNPDARQNHGKYLWEIYVWQEIAGLAKKRCEQSWDLLVGAGLIPTKDELRNEFGTRVLLESKHFALTADVASPRLLFDEDKLIKKLKRKYKESDEAVRDIIKDCYKESKAPVTLRVLEK